METQLYNSQYSLKIFLAWWSLTDMTESNLSPSDSSSKIQVPFKYQQFTFFKAEFKINKHNLYFYKNAQQKQIKYIHKSY